jgi:hypothetical protein
MPEEILWMQDVPAAFERAKKDAKPLLIAINAAFVDGGKAEPAGKELRDHTYKAKEVVAKAQLFVCALLKPDATSADYAELRTRFGMDGLVVSPQHIFVHADGTLIGRHEYWPHAHGQPSVDALLKLMDEALAAHKAKTGAGGGPVPTDPAAGVDARAAWIREQVAKLRDTTLDFATREVAGKELIKGDQKGDCLDPVCTFLLDAKKDTELQVALVRALGKPGLEFVVPTLCQLLDDRSDELRSNVAVTLEYVGSVRAVEPLTKRIGKGADEYTWNNCCRALAAAAQAGGGAQVPAPRGDDGQERQALGGPGHRPRVLRAGRRGRARRREDRREGLELAEARVPALHAHRDQGPEERRLRAREGLEAREEPDGPRVPERRRRRADRPDETGTAQGTVEGASGTPSARSAASAARFASAATRASSPKGESAGRGPAAAAARWRPRWRARHGRLTAARHPAGRARGRG